MSSDPNPVESPARSESLPNVEPPTAGFILQLFLIPLLIVSIVILLWLVFSWLAHAGQSDPQKVLKDLQRLGSNSGQRAYELMALMQEQSEEGEKRRNDAKFAAEVGKVLTNDLETYPGKITDSHARIRMFLCGALGEFEIPEAVPPLLKALEHRGTEESASTPDFLAHPDVKQKEAQSLTNNVQVRIASAEAIAKLADKMGSGEVRALPEVVPALTAASQRDPEADEADKTAADALAKDDPRMMSSYRPHAELRSVCAFVLGVLGGEEALDRLVQMAENDPYPNARYNAATGLARYGDERVTETLLEMLDAENKAPVDNEWHAAEKEQTLVNVIKAGLQATLRLVETNPSADTSQLLPAIEKLRTQDLSKIMYTVVAKDGSKTEKPLINSSSQRLIQLSATETLRRIEELKKEPATTAP